MKPFPLDYEIAKLIDQLHERIEVRQGASVADRHVRDAAVQGAEDMKPTPLDYELAKLIDTQGLDKVLVALSREAKERDELLLFRRLYSTYEWFVETGGKRRKPADGK